MSQIAGANANAQPILEATNGRRARPDLRNGGQGDRRWVVVSRRPLEGRGSLTTSEERVARLIASGRTNRTAAAELGVSPNTVATHLRSIFGKLGVNSRVTLTLAIVEWAEEMPAADVAVARTRKPGIAAARNAHPCRS